jgi:predicted outer membrane repeat protein
MKSLVSVLFCLAVFTFSTSHADVITVSGNVSGTWSADTVLVTGEALVPPGEVLEIMPGVQVLFTVNCKLIVQANSTLMAVGTEFEPIRFDAYNINNWWHGIEFLNAQDSSRLEHCILKRGQESALRFEYCSPTIANCIIDSCQANGDGGAMHCYYSSPIISSCVISNNSSNDDGGGIYAYESNITITDSEFTNNWASDWGGGFVCLYSNPIIIGNTFIGNSTNNDGGALGIDVSPSGIIADNLITYNMVDDQGAGIICWGSSPEITGNIISSNFAAGSAGGICSKVDSAPIINGNVIVDNATSQTGGGISCFTNGNTIENNIISNNTSFYQGGGIYCSGSLNIIDGNFISGNTVRGGYYGGGLYINSGSDHVVANNTVGYNFAANGGGVYVSYASNLDMKGNSVAHNTASGQCGGVYLYGGSGAFYKNTVRDNSSTAGGGLQFQTGSFIITNLIVRGNTPSQITGSAPAITYSDIEGGFPGTGNIDEDPLFATVAQPFSELLCGSPCIDSGDPDPMYLDPDTTRSDMGACFYDQSVPVRMLATPYDAPNLIPAAGGDFELKLTLSNHTNSQQPVLIYCDITLPDGSIYGPVIGPINYTAAPNSNISRIRTQSVPAVAPLGVYHYNAYAVMGTDTSMSSFIFGKLGVSDDDNTSGWSNSGDSFEGPISYTKLIANQPTEFSLEQNHPNPFNPVTTIGFTLPKAGMTKLTIFDLQGRRIASLIDDWYPAGDHEVVFDGSNFPSGIYLYRLEAGDFTASGKMVLLK